MTNQSSADPTKRFTGLADIYAKARPTYPASAIDHILHTAGLAPNAVIADVGCGTGISSRLFAARGFKVIGIEPNQDMRAQAKQAEYGDIIDYRDGTAEETGLPNTTADLVLAAQAFHWFRPEPALAEFYRILKPGGWVALIWNERNESDAFTKAYGDALRMTPETAGVEMHRGAAGEPLLTCKLFKHARRDAFANSQLFDQQGMIDRAFSASYAPKDEPGASNLRTRLQEIFAEFSKDGIAELHYETSVYLAQKPASA